MVQALSKQKRRSQSRTPSVAKTLSPSFDHLTIEGKSNEFHKSLGSLGYDVGKEVFVDMPVTTDEVTKYIIQRGGGGIQVFPKTESTADDQSLSSPLVTLQPLPIEENNKQLLSIKNANGASLAVLQKMHTSLATALPNGQDAPGTTSMPPKSPLTPKNLVQNPAGTLRLYGHTPLYPLQDAKRKATWSGPQPLYVWGSISERTSGVMGKGHIYTLVVPYEEGEETYTFKVQEGGGGSRGSSRNLQSKLKAFPGLMPFGKKRNSSNAVESPGGGRPSIFGFSTGSGDPSERIITCKGKVCATLTRVDSAGTADEAAQYSPSVSPQKQRRSQQCLTAEAGVDPLLMASFLASAKVLDRLRQYLTQQ